MLDCVLLNHMTYAQKLRDPRWQKKRLHILERDKWTCQSCRSTTKTLQVHHLFYAKREPWEYPDQAYQTLCEGCHRERQGIVDPLIEEFRVRIQNVPTNELAGAIRRAIDFIPGFAMAAGADAGDPSEKEREEKSKAFFAEMRKACGL